MPCADVRVSAHIVSNVPVTDNSHDLLYAQPGCARGVAALGYRAPGDHRLSKRGTGNIYQYALTVSTGILSRRDLGWRTRPVTLGELATRWMAASAIPPRGDGPHQRRRHLVNVIA